MVSSAPLLSLWTWTQSRGFCPSECRQKLNSNSRLRQLNSSLNEAFQNPAVRQRLARLQLTELPPITPTEFRATLTQDLAEWRRLVLKLGLKAE